MDGILDQLNQVIEARLAQIKDGMEEKNLTECLKETKEEVERMDRILRMLPRDEMEWLNDKLLERLTIPMEERMRYYKTGLSDAIELLRFLRA
ncbi:chemotaxis protein [Clostridium sp. M62/1]|uniref:hypothetical protein n=1 Tax=Clostridium sp. M62/1 TaxID=411486 RepID=UPI00019734B2|nr:hypothetical protein [Clostridium sp. M62/1]EFE12876.1 hypothetical protein CLOM621_07062 [Clostridium sp. M62/1]UEB79209.1 chemotaxis protein [Clostridium sp. M62/1]